MKIGKIDFKYMQGIYILFILIVTSFSYGFYKDINAVDKLISHFLFFPHYKLKEIPSDFGLKYEEVFINNVKNTNQLYGWYILADKPTNKNIIYLHGSKGNISTYIEAIEQLHKIGANILLVDYEGFGKSGGKALMKSTISDSIVMYDYLINKYKVQPKDICLFGYSYGGALAIELALKREVHAILLESTFLSLKKIATSKYSFLVSPIVSKNLFNTEENIKKIMFQLLLPTQRMIK